MPKIIVQKGADIVKTYNLPSRQEITIGCSTGCDVPIEDPALASELAKLVLKEDGFHLQLITHIPPVFVTGERVEGDVRLEDGDTIKIEDYNLILNILPGEIPEKEEPPPPPKPEPKPPEPPVVEKTPEPVAEKQPEPAVEKPLEKIPKPAAQKATEPEIPPAPEKKEEPPKPAPPPEPEPEKVETAPPPKPQPAKEDVSYMKTEEIKIDQDSPDLAEQSVKEPPPQPKPAPPPEPEKVEPTPPKPEPAPRPVEKPAPPQPVEDNRKTKVLSTSDQPPAKPEKPVSEKPARTELDMYLLAVAGPLSGEKFKLKKGITNIGRDRKQNDIVIRNDAGGELDKSISRKHAQVEYSNGRYLLSDRASQMRSMLNGKKLTINDTLPLTVGDIVEICSIKENSIFRVAEEGNFDFSPPAKSRSIRPVIGTGDYLPYVIVAAAAVIIIILLILLLK